jgi:hypothetical protein
MKRTDIERFVRAGPGAVSRRQFVGITAGAAGGVLGSGLLTPARGDAGPGEPACPAPDPIPHVTIPPIPIPIIAECARAHFFFPGNVEGTPASTDPTGAQPGGRDPSTIFDFDGVLGLADLNLRGTGTVLTEAGDGASAAYDFHTDMRFMAGKFVGTDGRVHHGAFAFI